MKLSIIGYGYISYYYYVSMKNTMNKDMFLKPSIDMKIQGDSLNIKKKILK